MPFSLLEVSFRIHFMKKIFTLILTLLSFSLFAETVALKIGSLNLQGWIDTSTRRAIIMKDLFKNKGLMNDVSLLITQESIEQTPLSTTDQLAKQLGWKSFSERRVSDNEGLGILYPKKADIEEILTLQLKAKTSRNDFSRMALMARLNHPIIGKIRVVNVHLAHQIEGGAIRRKQLREVIMWIQELEKSDPSDLLVLGGDFNTGRGDRAYSGEFDLLANSYFRFKEVRSTGASYTYKDMKTSNRRLIDHFFISQKTKLSIKSIESKIFREITDLKLSDHNLLILKIDIDI
jgi:endonuclease/exonuclease/phosphatase family metal-dependent hydrolase